MNVVIEIHYLSSGGKVLQSGSFPLRGRKPEYIAYEFWKQIQEKQPFEIQLENIILNGDQDITDLVKELEQQEINKVMNMNLPF
ncbi:hypothetical protein LRS37_04700 [Neobacillus sedimentimangrovi]|uniref:Uncharacterized protein n=1 Tax=Neobacillus sedimentimangrovi TaxID=2699460 RepID=A0ABS8QG79_9BACI|nr:hypothetical protein [Neobacillus sedimentimangrovi]MCD4838181.1 hypothetical protein [Neobacillus sedimentimangrovi]